MRQSCWQGRGFTFIEISVVLIIIGLIVGGVLVGRDLIKAAEIRKAISLVENYETATFTFRTKYNALPGDMANATDIFPIDTEWASDSSVQNFRHAARNGDGDGLIGGGCDDDLTVVDCMEPQYYWHELALANLIAIPGLKIAPAPVYSPGLTVPSFLDRHTAGISVFYYHAPFNGGGGAPVINNRHAFALGGEYSTQFIQTSIFSPAEGFRIDSKIDDGNVVRGKVLGSTNWNVCHVSAATGVYRSEDYHTTGEGSVAAGPGCALWIKTNF